MIRSITMKLGVVALYAVACSTLLGQEVSYLDQECAVVEVCHVIEPNEPIGQMFIPHAVSYAAVDLFLNDGGSSGSVVIIVSLHEDTIDGPVVPGSQMVRFPDAAGWVRFVFDQPVVLTAGQQYVLEVTTQGGTWQWCGSATGSDCVPFGGQYLEGVLDESADLSFRLWATKVGNAVDQLCAEHKILAFSYDAIRGMRHLGTLEGMPSVVDTAYDTNDQGHIVGQVASLMDPPLRAFLYEPDLGLQDLPFLPGSIFNVANGLNNHGQIVGYAQGQETGQSAVVWEDDMLLELPAPEGNSIAFDINDAGQAVGGAIVDGAPAPDVLALRWAKDGEGAWTMTMLDPPGSSTVSLAYDINEHGTVAGGFEPPDAEAWAVIWRESGTTELPPPEGFTNSMAAGINNREQVVGRIYNSILSPRAALWNAGEFIDLSDAISPPGWVFEEAQAINDRGQIAGIGTINGDTRAMLLSPDCDHNNVADHQDITDGVSDDINGNAVPDSCECIGDIDGDGIVKVDDIIALILVWGPCLSPPEPCPADLDGDGVVKVDDLIILVLQWGPCA